MGGRRAFGFSGPPTFAYLARVIARDAHLTEFLGVLSTAPWVALDTEADSLHAYPEKICLVQLSIPQRDVLIDPLAKLNLEPLWSALKGRELILHGADYDLRLLWRNQGFLPTMVFDTMLAARLLGYRSFGLINLVSRHLKVNLEKGPQKADWSRRPLTPRLEEYARNDSRFLRPLEELLREDLQETGRLAWHQETCRRLISQCSQVEKPDLDKAWRLKGSHKLSRPALAVLRALWHWREKEALSASIPPFFILNHDALVRVASTAAEGEAFDHWIPKRFSRRRQAELSEEIARALALPPDERPQLKPRVPVSRLSHAQRKRMRELEKKRDRQAEELKIDPTLIASRSMLIALCADGAEPGNILMKWQEELLFGGASGQGQTSHSPIAVKPSGKAGPDTDRK